ncbi:M20 family metallopeptidase [Lentiprolixibacter aurantiacus]|uniref:M20 family metallopeptidase n=1 Tax=Lentiprolixibacter aurantiacus TaxID=2993939 RepID=A0AAE3MN24_9FLAO|nr:M20 family metallopeptidase [Lentiprolixibacter aurantiacus]MCX2720761.1 M20 family metallopeptidase [Lentiprolixibacter aurantiacus]
MKRVCSHVAEILSFLHAHEDEMREFLGDLVSMETPSHNKEAQHIILEFLRERFEALGFHVLHVPGKKTGGYLYARPLKRNKNRPIQLLIGHCDTVWPTGTLQERPLSYEKGKIKGPGVYDMKAGLTQIFYALAAIQSMPLPIKVEPVVVINSDEEIGSWESTSIIKRLSRIASRAFILEPPLGLDGKLKTARKGIGRFTITVKGKAAHAGLDPTKGINAIVELSHQVQQLYAMNDYEKGITVNVGTIEGGISPNTVAPMSKAVVDVRVLSEKDGEFITKKIKSLKPHHRDVELIIEGAIGRPPMEKTPRNQELWRIAQLQGKQLGLKLEEATAGGGSDANTTSLYTASLDGLGTPGDGAHALHEFIFEKKLLERTALLTLLLLTEPINAA